MKRYKSPAKTAIIEELRLAQLALQKWEIIVSERAFQAKELLEMEFEAREEVRRIRQALADHYSALAAVERADRMERRSSAA